MAQPIYDACASVGEYTDREGNRKSRYVKIGAVFQGEKGMSLKLDTIPVAGWNGWISFFEPKPRDAAPQQQGNGYAARRGGNGAGLADMSDDIPFNSYMPRKACHVI